MISRIARRILSVLASGAIVATGLIWGFASPAQAGVLDTEIHDGQAFAVQRSPAYPTCSSSDGTFSAFALTQFERPYSTPAGQNPGDMGTDYLKLLASSDSEHPWRLGRFNAAGQELHYDSGSSSWVDPSSPAYASGAQWDDAGVVMALYEDGYFYESYPNAYGLFISLNNTYPLGGSTTYTPTSTYNDCTNTASYGYVALAKGSAIDAGGGGVGSTPTLSLALDAQVGSSFDGSTATISGSGLAADSAYDLTMHSDPVVIAQGVADGTGTFTATHTIPAQACLPGLHELTLTGTAPDESPITATKYLELATDCTVMQVSDSAITASMPDTGVSIRNGIIISVSAIVFFGLAMVMYRLRRGLVVVSINQNVARTLAELTARLNRMDDKSARAAARNRWRNKFH